MFKEYLYSYNGKGFLRAEKVQIPTSGGWSDDGLRYAEPRTYTGAGEYEPVPAEEVPADKRDAAVAAYHANMAKAAELCAKYDRAQELKTWEKTTEPVAYESGNEWYPYVFAEPQISGGDAAWVTYAGNNPEDVGEYMGYIYGPDAPTREQLIELLDEMLENAE